MDELDILKKDWQQRGNTFAQLSEQEIYGMKHRSSSSIVKWLLLISVAEFAFWTVLTIVLSDDKYQVKLHRYGIEDLMFWVNAANYAILVAFIFFFYRNYRTISTTDSTRLLMKNILRTRRTVQYYIWYNLGIVFVNVILTMLMMLLHDKNTGKLLDEATTEGHRTLFLIKYSCMWGLIIVVLTILFWLFYRILYGILLRKLLANYKELSAIDQ